MKAEQNNRVPVPEGNDRFQQRRIVFGTMRIDYKVVSSDVNGSLLILKNTNPTKGGPPRHVHHDQEEWFYVVKGEYVIEIGGQSHRLGVGDSLRRRLPACSA